MLALVVFARFSLVVQYFIKNGKMSLFRIRVHRAIFRRVSPKCKSIQKIPQGLQQLRSTYCIFYNLYLVGVVCKVFDGVFFLF